MKNFDLKLYRIMDANFNRAKEGLRVCEDIFRFWNDNPGKTRGYKNLRHRLTGILSTFSLGRLIASRDADRDVGKRSSATEMRRNNVGDIFLSNSQRAKESIRVLEEFAKIKNPRTAAVLKKLRYDLYTLEKHIVLSDKKTFLK